MKLTDPVTSIPFVGEAYAKRLKKLEIATVSDLLQHVPSRYVDFRHTTQISRLRAGETATINGQITSIQNIYTKTGKLMQLGILSDGENKINIIWFNQYYLTRALPPGTEVSISGKVSFWQRKLVIFSPQYEKTIVDGGERNRTVHTGRLIPIYPETAGVSSKWLRSRISHVLRQSTGLIDKDYLDSEIRSLYKLSDLRTAVANIHLPASDEEANEARKRLAFDELLQIQVENNLKKISWQKYSQSLPIKIDRKKLAQFINALPFKLTPSQARSIDEISEDLERTHPMNRLLEGDVGSGKTVIAAAGAYIAFLNGFQSLVMAPTQILASQHLATFRSLLANCGVRVSLMTSETAKTKKGDCDVLIGTHALISKTANFKKVAFVVIDEQHRFGVKQRGKLAKKAVSKTRAPNILRMTATPIPRTIALTLYGDLNLSTLDEIPTVRPLVTTWIVPETKRQKAYDWLANLVKKEKSQAFIVCPLIEESESEPLKEVKAVKLEITKLKKILPTLKIGLLHGQLKAVEKDKVLADFKKKKYDILVSTPVVEVGIDIPNATIMVIETAERYGLAQLHQLRGRVGRGAKKSYCLLFTTNRGKKVKERLTALTKSHSGRELAELDLRLRGVGEIFGTKQHGVGELKIATWQDVNLIKNSRQLAMSIVNNQQKHKRILDYFRSKQPANN